MRVLIVGSEGLMGKRRKAVLAEDDEARGYDVACAAGDSPLFKELVDWCDAAIVAVPHDVLVPMAMLVVGAGRPVLLEKPCARSAWELAALEREARRRGIPIVPGFTLRHFPGIDRTKVFLALHPPRVIRVLYGHPGRDGYSNEWRCNPERGGGELLDQGVHLIDLAHHLCGPVRLGDYHPLYGRWSARVESDVFLRLEGEKGIFVGQASWTLHKPTFRLEVECHDGAWLEVIGLDGGYGIHTIRMFSAGDAGEEVIAFDGSRTRALRAEWEHFKRCVAKGESRIDDALAVLRVVDSCRLRD
jgi:predicted dehydrogenase